MKVEHLLVKNTVKGVEVGKIEVSLLCAGSRGPGTVEFLDRLSFALAYHTKEIVDVLFLFKLAFILPKGVGTAAEVKPLSDIKGHDVFVGRAALLKKPAHDIMRVHAIILYLLEMRRPELKDALIDCRRSYECYRLGGGELSQPHGRWEEISVSELPWSISVILSYLVPFDPSFDPSQE
jgi:hypothetical protein